MNKIIILFIILLICILARHNKQRTKKDFRCRRCQILEGPVVKYSKFKNMLVQTMVINSTLYKRKTYRINSNTYILSMQILLDSIFAKTLGNSLNISNSWFKPIISEKLLYGDIINLIYINVPMINKTVDKCYLQHSKNITIKMMVENCKYYEDLLLKKIFN